MNVASYRLIFLDFDGVLHAEGSNATLFEHNARLAEVLAPHPDVRIVVSSSWRNAHDEEELKEFLEAVGGRMLGVTPKLAGALRQDEIEVWLQDNFEGAADIDTERNVTPWIALDDMPRLFRPGCPWLLPTDPHTGMDQKAWGDLQVWLETGKLPPEVVTEGSVLLKHSFSCAPDMPLAYRLHSRSKRLELEAPHLDTYQLCNFLSQSAHTLGISNLWRDDDQRNVPNHSEWFVTLNLPLACFEVEAIQLSQAIGGQRALVLRGRDSMRHPSCFRSQLLRHGGQTS